MQYLWNWVINLPLVFTEFFTWLTEPLPYINQTPLGLFSYIGLTALIVVLLIRLIIGG